MPNASHTAANSTDITFELVHLGGKTFTTTIEFPSTPLQLRTALSMGFRRLRERAKWKGNIDNYDVEVNGLAPVPPAAEHAIVPAAAKIRIIEMPPRKREVAHIWVV
ncbi:MAG: hypothetical protein JO019_04275 [Candidatus Kaiserbacteria bacterium]|nr:hypothetical protein [Candidatus Kaiserbacteria bacterium]